MYVSTKHLNHNDMRPRFDDATYEQILKEAAALDVKPNVYLRMLAKAALQLSREERIRLLLND